MNRKYDTKQLKIMQNEHQTELKRKLWQQENELEPEWNQDWKQTACNYVTKAPIRNSICMIACTWTPHGTRMNARSKDILQSVTFENNCWSVWSPFQIMEIMAMNFHMANRFMYNCTCMQQWASSQSQKWFSYVSSNNDRVKNLKRSTHAIAT